MSGWANPRQLQPFNLLAAAAAVEGRGQLYMQFMYKYELYVLHLAHLTAEQALAFAASTARQPAIILLLLFLAWR
jgi:hypothetical protein